MGNNDNSAMEEMEDMEMEDQRTIVSVPVSEEFDPKLREGVLNLKNDKVFKFIQVVSGQVHIKS